MPLKFDNNRRQADDTTGSAGRDATGDSGKPLGIGRLVGAVNRSILDRSGSDEARENREDAILKSQLSEVHVVAFVGSSGTGKSTRAMSVARQYSIDHIIDDGLLINGSRIIAGSSAKRAGSKLESVRQALFADMTRSMVMRRAIASQRPNNLMVLGTSDGMIARICENLWLPQPTIIIRIEDVSTEDEMRLAQETRMTEGMHSIPVPSMEIKHEFSGYFSDPLNRLRRRRDRERGLSTAMPDSERTMVRPTFSSLGSYSLSDEALRNMVEVILRNTQGVHSLLSFSVVKEVYGIVLYLDISLYYGFNAQDILDRAQQRISSRIEEYTSINVIEVNIKARRLVHAAGSARPASEKPRPVFDSSDAPEMDSPDHGLPESMTLEGTPVFSEEPSVEIVDRMRRLGSAFRGFFGRK